MLQKFVPYGGMFKEATLVLHLQAMVIKQKSTTSLSNKAEREATFGIKFALVVQL